MLRKGTLSLLFALSAVLIICYAIPAPESIDENDGKSSTFELSGPVENADSAGTIETYKRLMLHDSRRCYVCTRPCSRYYCCNGAQCTYYRNRCYCLR